MDQDFLTPEMVQQMVGLSGDPEQKALLERRMAQAQALRNKAQAHHTTGIGAALGGLGDMVNAYSGSRQYGAAEQDYKNLIAQELPARQRYGQLLEQQMMGDAPVSAGQDVPPSVVRGLPIGTPSAMDAAPRLSLLGDDASAPDESLSTGQVPDLSRLAAQQTAGDPLEQRLMAQVLRMRQPQVGKLAKLDDEEE